jgi:hypothetical protein
MLRQQRFSNYVISALHIAVSTSLSAMLIYVINSSLGRLNETDFLGGWALLHGSFLIVIPIFAIFGQLFYFLLRPVARRLQSRYSAKK